MTTNFDNLDASVETILADINNLPVCDRMKILLALSENLGFVCLEGFDFEERESFENGYLAFIHKDRGGQ